MQQSITYCGALCCFCTGTAHLTTRLLYDSPLPSPKMRPPIAARGSGGENKLSQRSRPPNVSRCIPGINLHPFDCSMANNFVCLVSIKRNFPQYICSSLSQPKKKIYGTRYGSRLGEGIVSLGECHSPLKKRLEYILDTVCIRHTISYMYQRK